MEHLATIVGSENISDRLIDRLAFARDASLYRLLPECVVRPVTPEHISKIMSWCTANGKHLAFRAAGTSLSGQAVTDGILIDLSRFWKSCTVLDEGAKVCVQPGVTGGRVNAKLMPYGTKLGPDPASLNACMIGGIVANNASGMCCGTTHNSYHTIDSMRYMLTDGTRIDTASQACDTHLATASPNVHVGIARLRDEIRTNTAVCERIRHKYRIKNTIGYSINAFLDEDEPARILARLMVGSEGTLGFIEEVTFRTIPDARHKLTTLLVFESLDDACSHTETLVQAGAAAVELMDDASIASFATLPTTPEAYRIHEPNAVALLVEFHAHTVAEAERLAAWATAWSGDLRCIRPVVWTSSAEEQAVLWRLRKGLMPTLGAMRPSGTTMVNEDIAVPVHHLPALVRDVRRVCIDHGYNDAIIFGHAKDGNIHFVLNKKFSSEHDLARYCAFMDDIAHIVIDVYDGSLKAEHGTGRNMAPYVELEWGNTITQFMRELKSLLDPHNILNPDVVLSANPNIHIENIKSVPDTNGIVDKCIECGFCEHVCPSRNITLTPRQRIGILRELQGSLTPEQRSEVLHDYEYASVDTCAADGMCELACPVSINTGTLVKHLRSESPSIVTRAIARSAAKHFGITNALMSLATPTLLRWKSSVKGLRRNTSSKQVRIHQTATHPSITFLLLPACGTRWLSTDADLLLALADRAGLTIDVPQNANSMCCGQIFESRGLMDASREVSQTTTKSLRAQVALSTAQGVSNVRQNAIVVVDSTTCAHALQVAGQESLKIIDSVTFLDQYVLPRLTITQVLNHVVLHPGCGAHQLGVVEVMRRVAERCAKRVTIPVSAGCCGMAGDRGLRYPELLESALRDEVRELEDLSDADGWFGANATCELGLRQQTGKPWQSLASLVEEATR